MEYHISHHNGKSCMQFSEEAAKKFANPFDNQDHPFKKKVENQKINMEFFKEIKEEKVTEDGGVVKFIV